MNDKRSYQTPLFGVLGRSSDRSNACATVLVMGLLAVGLASQSLTYLNHDVAWVLYSSARLLDGAELGSEIVAANPPLIWWISLIPNMIASETGLPLIEVFRALVIVGSAAAIYAVRKMALPEDRLSWKGVAVLVSLAWLLVFSPHRDFGQREHLTVLLILPYLAAIIGRLEGRNPSRNTGLLIGIAAGLGIALKPYFLFVPLIVEGLFLARSREWVQMVRPEALGAALAVACYGLALLLFASDWLFAVVPDIQRVYWAFEDPPAWRAHVTYLALPFMLFVWSAFATRSVASQIIGAAAVGFFIAAVIQGKFYSYHIYPSFALLAFAGLHGVLSIERRLPVTVIGFVAAFLVSSVIVAHEKIVQRTASGSVGRSIAELTEFVAANVPEDGSFISISTHPYPGFPTVLYAGRKWGSTTNSRIFLPAVVKLRSGESTRSAEFVRFAETKAHDALLQDLRSRPELILVDQRRVRHAIGATQFDFMTFYRENAEIDRMMARYGRVADSPRGYAAYVLVDSPINEGGAR